MTSNSLKPTTFTADRVNERQVFELMGIARGVIADGNLNNAEIDFLQKWLVANDAVKKNPVIAHVLRLVNAILADGIVDADERSELSGTLLALTGNNFELGELLKATTLPLCDPAPNITFPGMRFTFTGTFTFGTRQDCENAVEALGATTGRTVTKMPGFLVIGEYATDDWQHSSFGRKIEKAFDFRRLGAPISIISEAHWIASLR